MARLFLYALSDDLHSLLLTHWLDVDSLVRLDVAVSCAISRPYWRMLLGSLRSASIGNMDHSASSLMWLIQRGICASRVQMKDDGWRVPGCDLSFLKTINLLHLGVKGCSRVTDQCILKAVMRRYEGLSEDVVSGRNMIRDAGVSVLRAGYGQLRSIDLEGCKLVTDACVVLDVVNCRASILHTVVR